MDGSSPRGAGWLGRIELRLEESAGVTRLTRRRHEGPLMLQRPFYPEGDALPHLYLLHPPGGVVGGDRLETEIQLGARAQALVTTPAAQKLYRSAGPDAVQTNSLTLAAGAELEWLPSEVIVFDGAKLDTTTRVALAADAAFIGWEIGCLGRLSSGDRFRRGRFVQRFEIEREGRPLFIDRFAARGGGAFLDASWGLRGFAVVATLCAVPRRAADGAALVEALRGAFGVERDLVAAASDLGEVVVVRVLGPSVERARGVLARAWSRLRPALLGREAVPPRIWAT